MASGIAIIVLCSPVYGFVAGKLTYFWLEVIVSDPITEIMVTVSSVYITFYVGEDTSSKVLPIITWVMFIVL